jgi:hypothetical protein
MRPVRLVPVILTVLALGTQAAPAGAAPSDAETHCVVEVVAQAADGELLTGQIRCHETFAEAMAAASDGRLWLPASTPGSVVFTDAAVAETVSSFTLGIHYDGASGSGSSISVVGSSCSGGYWNTPSTWDNRISSSWNGCARLRHWDGPSKTGSYQDTSGVGTTDNLTTMNNRTESVSYHAS